MPLPAKLTVAALVLPLAAAPTAHASARVEAPVAVSGPAAAPTGWESVGVATPSTAVAVTTTTTTTTTATTTTTTTTIPAAPAVAPTPVVSPREAVRTLLRYDPYLAPRYRSGRNMAIGGGISLGIGTMTLLLSASWAWMSRAQVESAFDEDDRRRTIDERNQGVRVARVFGVAGAAMAIAGVVLVTAGAIKKRRAVEEARGRVYMQAGPGGMQVRF